MATQKVSKKLPKRAARKSKHEARARSKATGAEKKRLQREAQRQREIANERRRASGEPTPWERAKAARYVRRHGG